MKICDLSLSRYFTYSIILVISFIIIIFIKIVLEWNFYILISVVEVHGTIYIIEKFVYESN